MSEQHTDELLRWFETEDGQARINPVAGGMLVAECRARKPFDPEQQANARRLVASWNELLAVPVEALETGAVARLVEAAREQRNVYAKFGVGGMGKLAYDRAGKAADDALAPFNKE